MRTWPGDVVTPDHHLSWFRELGSRAAAWVAATEPRALAAATLATLVAGLAGALALSLGGNGHSPGGLAVTAPHPAVAPRTAPTVGPGSGGSPGPVPGSHPHRAPAGRGPAPAEVLAAAVGPLGAGPVVPAPVLLPIGKGMWFHHLEAVDSPPEQVVEQARAAGLTHLFLRLGSSRSGFYAQGDLDRLLPVAHAAGIKVVGWDFPYLDDPVADAERAAREVAYTTPDGHRIDAFSADIETPSEGVALSAERVDRYGAELRARVGARLALIGTVPNACVNQSYPYAEVARHFDALAPMVYWITRDPAAEVACNLAALAAHGRPVLPVGQAYDPAIDNPALTGLAPRYEDLKAFLDQAAAAGAPAVSFWAWHTARPGMWRAIAESPHFTLIPVGPDTSDPGPVLTLQRVLRAYGYGVALDGRFGPETRAALGDLQRTLGLPASGRLDEATVAALTAPLGGPSAPSG